MARKNLSPFAAALVAAAIAAVPVVSSTGGTTALWSVSDTVLAGHLPIKIEPSVPEQPLISVPPPGAICWSSEKPYAADFFLTVTPADGTLQVTVSGAQNENTVVRVGSVTIKGNKVELLELNGVGEYLVTAENSSGSGTLKNVTVSFEVVGSPKSVGSVTILTSCPEAAAVASGVPSPEAGAAGIEAPDQSAGNSAVTVAEAEEPNESGDPDPEAVQPGPEGDDSETVTEQFSPDEPSEEPEAESTEDLAPAPAPDESEADEAAPDGSVVEGPLAIIPLPQVIETAPAPEPDAAEPGAEHEDCGHLDAEHSADECPGLLPEDEAVKPEPEEGVEPEPAPEPEPEDGVEPEPESSPDEVL